MSVLGSFLSQCIGIRACVHDLRRKVRFHHADLSRRPCIHHIRADRLAVHHDISASECLADHHVHLRNGGIGKCVRKLCRLSCKILLVILTRLEPGYIGQRKNRDIEGIAEVHEPGGLLRSVGRQRAVKLCRNLRLLIIYLGTVRNRSHRHTVQTDEAGHHILRIILLRLKEYTAVRDDRQRDSCIFRRILDPVAQTVQAVRTLVIGSILLVIARQHADQSTDIRQYLVFCPDPVYKTCVLALVLRRGSIKLRNIIAWKGIG